MAATPSYLESVAEQYNVDPWAAAQQWFRNAKSKVPLELCDTVQPHGWGFTKANNGRHKTPDQVMAMLEKAAAMDANLLLNTGPLPDGSIQPEDIATSKACDRHRASAAQYG